MLRPSEEALLQISVRLRDEFSKNLKGLERNTERTSKSMKRSFSGVTAGISRLKAGIVGAVAAYAGWRGVQAAWDATKTYAKLEAVQLGFDQLREGVGIAADAIDRWRSAVRSTIGDSDLLQQANEAIISGLVKSEKEFTALSRAAFYFGRLTGQEVLPALQQLVAQLSAASPRALRRLGIDMEEVWRKERELTGRELPLEIKQRTMINELMKKLERGYGEIEKLQTTSLEKIQQAAKYWGDAKENIGQAAKGMTDYNVAMAKAAEIRTAAFRDMLENLGEFARAHKEGDPLWGLFEDPDKRMKMLRQAAQWQKEWTKEQDELPARRQKWMDYLDSVEHGTQVYREAAENIRTAAAATWTVWQELGHRMAEIGESISGGWSDYVAEIGGTLGDLRWTTLESFRSLEEGLGTFFFDAMTHRLKSFKDYVRSFLEDLGDIFSRFLAREAIRSLLGQVAGGLMGGISYLGSGITGEALPNDWGAGTTITEAQGAIPWRQHGGPVLAGRLYRVNEEISRTGRAEYFRPNVGGQVIPLAAGAGAGGGTVIVNNHVHVTAMDSQDTMRALHKVKGWLAQETTRVIHNHPHLRAFYRGL